MDNIRYFERSTGKVCLEKVYGQKALSLLYGTSLLSRMLLAISLHTTRLSLISRLYGYLQKKKTSQKKIRPFIEAYGVDESEFADPVTSFQSFNEFFIRKLKPECRPMNPHSEIAILPADGRYLVFPDLSKAGGFYVKGQCFDLGRFLKSSVFARRFENGAMAIARLCPTDYHRFHFPISGKISEIKPIRGALYSVNPVALVRRFATLCENKRILTEIDSERFGTVLMVEVGATCVGTIHQTWDSPSIAKGEEKGYFSFGGSCIVLLFEKGRIAFDEDLVRNSAQFIETRGLFGTSLGRALK